MKNSDSFWSATFIGFHIGLIQQGGWIISILLLLIKTLLCLIVIVSDGKTTHVWKPLYISFTGLLIGLTLFILKFNKWIDEK